MEPIEKTAVQALLQQFCDHRPYVHLETTNGAYAAEGLQGKKAPAVGVYVRNARLLVRGVRLAGDGPYRVGLETPGGWLYAEGLTHWTATPGRLELAGRDSQDRLMVALQLSLTPFRFETQTRVIKVPGAVPPEPAAPGSGPLLPPERHVLVILPHPDDETLATGGMVALHTRQGNPVTYACATLGEMGRNMGTPALATRETLASLRERELLAALAELGVGELRLLGMWDKSVEFHDREAVVDQIRGLLSDIDPSLVITYHPQFSVHPDHLALGAAVVEAVRALPAARRPRLLVRAFGSQSESLGPPDLVVDVRPVMDVKLAAVRAHRSQTGFMLSQWEAAGDGDGGNTRQELEARWAEEKYWEM